jgi:Lipocalin-like domain
MKRRSNLNIVIVVLTATGLGLFSNSATSQQNSLKEQLVGTWSFVSSNANGPDGRPQWGENPKGLFIISDSGHFSWQLFRSDRPHLASNNRMNATVDELKALNQGTLAYFGTYSVDEVEKTVTFRTDASTYPNSEGEVIKRVITKITSDEMISACARTRR